MNAGTVGQRSIFALKEMKSSPSEISHSFWAALNRLDECITAPTQGSVGEMRGDRLCVQWWSDASGVFFAAQVLDTVGPCMWEVFHVPTTEVAAIAGRRVCWGDALPTLEGIWSEVFSGRLGDDPVVLRHPAFAELVAAGCSSAGVVAVQDERALIEHLRADVSYWSQLARAMDKGRKRDVEALPYLAPAKKAVSPASASESPSKTWLMRDIDRWAAQNSERIVILPRAISATKRSAYESPESLYASLELLATHYTDVKQGRLDWNGLKDHMAAAGVEIRPVGSLSAGGPQIESYHVRWRGQKRFLDQHLIKGVSRDPRYCLRIYFTFDEELGLVVVGSMPEHLSISTT